MRVGVLCEESGVVRDAFAARGHDAWSCDILPRPGKHIRGDCLAQDWSGFDLLICHPPCTYLSRAGARWWKDPRRTAKAESAAEFVFRLRDMPVERIAIENPIGQLHSRWRPPDQVIQPWQFGHPFSKATCLWLKNLPKLSPTHICDKYEPLLPSNTGRGRRIGQRSHSGHTRDAREASRTFPGIASAMADQWGSLPQESPHA